MAGTNDFLPIATQGTPNVQDQADYAGSSVQQQGFANGGVPPAAIWNKMLRQASSIGAAFAQVVANYTNLNMQDNADLATLEANILAMFTSIAASAVNPWPDTGTTNHLVITPSPVVTLSDGMHFTIKPAHTNTGATDCKIGAATKSVVTQDNAALNGNTIVAGGEIELIYSAGLDKLILNTPDPGQFSAGSSGWLRFPGSFGGNPVFLQWASYSINPNQTTNVPAGFFWGQTSVSLPITPPQNTVLAAAIVPNVQANGQLVLGALNPVNVGGGFNGNGGPIYQTAYNTSATPLIGIVWTLCY